MFGGKGTAKTFDQVTKFFHRVGRGKKKFGIGGGRRGGKI